VCKVLQFPERSRISTSPPVKTDGPERERSFYSFVARLGDKLAKGKISKEAAHVLIESFLEIETLMGRK
jgi:hypothetical protein